LFEEKLTGNQNILDIKPGKNKQSLVAKFQDFFDNSNRSQICSNSFVNKLNIDSFPSIMKQLCLIIFYLLGRAVPISSAS